MVGVQNKTRFQADANAHGPVARVKVPAIQLLSLMGRATTLPTLFDSNSLVGLVGAPCQGLRPWSPRWGSTASGGAFVLIDERQKKLAPTVGMKSA
jgi:hypothetical protein